jgi:serine/threonine protein kinase
MDVRADEYLKMIEQLNEKEQADITTCVFENATHTFAHTLTLGLSATQLLSTMTIAAKPNGSKAMSIVLNKEFPPDSEERAKLIVLLKLDIRKALGKLVDMSILDLGKGSIVILFCFVPQLSQTADDVAALEVEYLKQVEDEHSELRSGELTRSIDAVRTRELTTQLDMGVNKQRLCPYKPGHKISFSSVGDHRKNCEIVSVLGEGASSTVFKVKILADGRACALKVFNTENHLLELSREASLLLTLNHPKSHPNVIGIDFVWFEQSKDEMFFLMEFAGDGTLQDWMNDERLYTGSEVKQQERLASIAHQLARAVQHLHSFCILHQDVKPDNVLMTDEGKPVLADVGVSHRGTGKSGHIKATLKGASPAFASPHVRNVLFEAKSLPVSERARFLGDNSITQLADIWCVAATVFSMFAESGWRNGRSFAEIWSEPEASLFELRVPPPKRLQRLLNTCFSAGAADASQAEELLTMKSIADEIGKLLQQPAPQLRDGFSNKHCSIIHNNLGLGLREHGHVSEAREQYKRAILADRSGVQSLEFHVIDRKGKPFALEGVLDLVGGVEALWEIVHEKLQQVLGVADHPVGCG